MIRIRRQTHRYVFAGLAVFIPTLLFAGIGLRPDVPPTFTFDSFLLSQAGFATDITTNLRHIQAGKHTFEVGMETDTAQSSTLLIQPTSIILKPDLLVYWTPDTPTNERLQGNALLLGEISGTSLRRMPIPRAVGNGSGTVIIFSFAHQDIIAQFPTSEFHQTINE